MINNFDDLFWQRYSNLADEEDALIDTAMMKSQMNSSDISDDDIKKTLTSEMREQAKSITRRYRYGKDMDINNLSYSKLKAAIEGNVDFYNEVEAEMQYQDKISKKD